MNLNRYIVLPICLWLIYSSGVYAQAKNEPITVGWIGAMTGHTAKWGAYQAALLGLEDVNSSGGINGRPLKIIFEDTGCNGKNAVSAFRKLTTVDNVKFILGGHCSPDSLAFAPLAEQKKILSIAAITSTPKLSNQGDYIFRVTPVSTQLADLLAPYVYNKLDLRKLSIIHEQTDYVTPVVEKMKSIFENLGGSVISVNAFNAGETDFKSLLAKVSKSADSIYIGVQSPDTALLIMRQFRELGLKQPVFGNEQFAGALLSSDKEEEKDWLEGVIFAEPVCDLDSASVRDFSDKYKKIYKTDSVPFGCYTGEAYDSVRLLAESLIKCGESTECLKNKLYTIRDYSGASGAISFNRQGDVDKSYLIKQIINSTIQSISPEI